MARVKLYDNLAGSYDRLISWKRRLRREKPFFTRLFRGHKVRRVLDTACGTGMHAIAFHDWGYYVVGADLSEPMVEQARANAGGRRIPFVTAGFTDTDAVNGMFDAVTCLGNSLPHVLTDDELLASLGAMWDQLVPGGLLVIHGNNYDRILSRKERFMPLAHRDGGSHESLFVRFFDFDDDYDLLTFNVLSIEKESGQWRLTADASTHRALTSELLMSLLQRAGFDGIRLYGGFPDEPYDREESDNLIVVAERPHTVFSCPRPEPVRAIDAIPVRENGDELVELSAYAPEFALKDPPTFVRRPIADMMKRAQLLLPEGHRLMVKCGLRTLERQRTIYTAYYDQVAAEHPEWPVSRVRREVNKFLAPPDAKHPPGHSTGGAVDVTIVDSAGRELDMTTSLKGEADVMGTLPTYSRDATPLAARNRQILIDAMGEAGFSNYPGEWWHWSYGDSAWAVRTGAAAAPYGAAVPPKN